ncbi:hypothetical protein [Flammeovirga aprica]|uniref:Uncharacterized protein n=1 Tax=Flammeovirga aprica JL-4 TaxID=694437 RepID=A0A7X9RXH9_9BACT|nr:hypothetical protein [Flammeovirga aprica]NME70561.1 hypothetical protein [Flammeovirga aprica JL-4]
MPYYNQIDYHRLARIIQSIIEQTEWVKKVRKIHIHPAFDTKSFKGTQYILFQISINPIKVDFHISQLDKPKAIINSDSFKGMNFVDIIENDSISINLTHHFYQSPDHTFEGEKKLENELINFYSEKIRSYLKIIFNYVHDTPEYKEYLDLKTKDIVISIG